ncbi:type IV pili methyl-accepting chemotaxis transducer N-terminal domain-containing protein [Paraburkholderia sp. CNPSo 3274]|uniref:type IV pili methyl-accepting chemotaxis transducer N-terminal domain-containing protein n=1 Tax=Paraburkholderia sp. CNPSo 3274 TaxID=2940932 RepID=UPI0020B845EB|nr:type IV pili methyl-accepting chemotaxis transducer N-terminal domain-containing protein [Paraburkholderia sp. CNPSo 3274]MCP3709078.1 type IV pili methyl-accepting chemotaxis transducer N-terminal domain-containing protein [Paraburkholderia sp. CNPSo 3274]
MTSSSDSATASTGCSGAQAAPFPKRLSTRIVVLSTVALALVLAMISGTLWLSWQLEGGGAAINDAGSLRMRANAVAIALWEARTGRPSQVDAQMHQLDETLRELRDGDPARPLFLPADAGIHAQFERVATAWKQTLTPAALRDLAASGGEPSTYIGLLPGFVDDANRLVSLIERENARKTAWLRISQVALAALSCVGTMAIVYLLYQWFVAPVQRLQDGLARIEAREFDTRLPVETYDEFGHLTQGFNRMVAELQALYQDLAERVDAKTAQLAAQNRELATLYEMAAFLNTPGPAESVCHDFLTRVMREFDADGGTVRVVSPDDGNLHLLVSEGMPESITRAEQCMPAADCACGGATAEAPVVFGLMAQPGARAAGGESGQSGAFTQRCLKAGFVSVAVSAIVAQNETLGTFSLHFRREREIPPSGVQLLQTLGRHLGVALMNRRLVALGRQLAVSEERNLVAQGLHDSIAQGLSFLKMQVHLLDGAAEQGDLDEIREIVPLLAGGVEESYDDVRELLLNFRTKLGPGKLRLAVEDTVARFRRQSDAELTLDYRDEDGPPLPPDQQLQVLFVLQEALSNARKHAQALHVQVSVVNARDFRLTIEDDGVGYDPADIASRGESHVGFHIMHERARRLAAVLTLQSAPGRGARVELVLPAASRKAA